jgi:hypothetical protein
MTATASRPAISTTIARMRVVRAFAMYLPSVACRHPYDSRSAQAEATSERGARGRPRSRGLHARRQASLRRGRPAREPSLRLPRVKSASSCLSESWSMPYRRPSPPHTGAASHRRMGGCTPA